MRVLILTTVMAPYRMKLFELLGEQCDLTVCFEVKNDVVRNDNWYFRKSNNFTSVELKKWEKGTNVIHWDILKIMRGVKPHLIVLYEYSTKTSFLLSIIARSFRIPYLINCDGAFISRNWLKKQIKKMEISNAAGLLAGSDSARQYFKYYNGKEKNIYSHNFTSLYVNDILSEVLSSDEKSKRKKELDLLDKKTVISVGNFVKEKGFMELIHAWKNVNKDYQLVIIGSGKQKKEYLKYIQKESLNNVKILDFMQYKDLKKYYIASDLFILNTKSDVWGLVINEAMSCGLPVITTDMCIAGLELIKDGENGYIIHTGNKDEIIESIKTVFEDEDRLLEMSKNSLETIREYTIENIAISHMKTFRKIVRLYKE